MSLTQIRKEINSVMSKEKAQFLQKYFKTGEGEYAQGDIFRGISVPLCRQIAHKYAGSLSFEDLKELLSSKIHEERFIALEAITYLYSKSEEIKKQEIYNFYLQNTKQINNWDLVDTSAPHVVGNHLLDKERAALYKLAKSENLWEKRISIVATYYFIKNNQFEDTLKISEILLQDKHDLIHKACGWMLREVGKCDQKVLEAFLKKHYKAMPRTMLRYAIERFPEERRQAYLKGTI